MAEWWTYRPEDFLLFSPRVYWRLFELHNAAVWPAHVFTLAAGIALAVLIVRRGGSGGRVAALVLAALWAFIGWAFFWERYATINWAAVYVAPVFLLEALLLLGIGGVAGGLSFDRRGVSFWLGILLLAFAVVGQPLLAPLLGRSWTAAEVFGIAPDPTALGTLGVLLAARGRLVPLLCAIPVLWCVASSATLWTMDAPAAWLPLATAALATAALVRNAAPSGVGQ